MYYNIIIYKHIMGTYFFDQYSLLHLASGIVAYFWGITLVQWIFIHFLFEYVENTEWGINFINTHLKNVWPGGKDGQDSLLNSFGDNFFGILGWLIAYHIDNMGKKHGWFVVEQ
jgi:hypothetical protein